MPEQPTPTRNGDPRAGTPEASANGAGPARLVALVLAAAVVIASILVAVYVPTAGSSPSVWGPAWAETTDSLFLMGPRTNARLLDEEIYLGTLHGVERGAGFYEAQHDMFNANAGRWNTYSPLTYRQPFLTYLWLVLGSGAAIGLAYGVLAGISMLVAYRAATSLVRPVFATLAPLALGLVYVLGIVHPPRILYAEMWAAPLLVTAGALCAIVLEEAGALQPNRRRLWVFSALGAMSALLAMATRELSVVPVSFAVAALVLDRDTRAGRLWIPWVVSIASWSALYALHASQVRAIAAGDIAPPVTQGGLVASYFHPGLAFLSACVRWVSTTPVVVPVVVLLCAAAVAGAFTLTRTGMRVLVGGSTIGLLVVLVVTGTPGTYANGAYLGYWGFLFIPVVVAWAPLGLRLFPRSQSAEAPSRP